MPVISVTSKPPHPSVSVLKKSSLVILGGLLIGISVSLPLAMVWPYPDLGGETGCVGSGAQFRLLGVVLPLDCTSAFIFTRPLVWASFLIAGAVFGLVAQYLVGRGPGRRAAALGGLAFFVAGFTGSQVVDASPRPEMLPVEIQAALRLSDIAPPFSLLSFVVAFAVVLTIGLVLHIPSAFRIAFAAAVTTALAYFVVASLLFNPWVDPVPLAENWPPTWRPMGPMMRTVLTSNLVAGTTGGWAALLLIVHRTSRGVGKSGTTDASA